MSQGYGLPATSTPSLVRTGDAFSTALIWGRNRAARASDTQTMETLGGYRLVRKLGSGQRAEIHLGHAGVSEPPDGDRIAAIKVYRAATDGASIDSEIDALARADSPHLLELKDLATGPDGRPCLILPRLGSGSLGRLLALRGRIEPGEAVSILVPLIEAVRELHRVGVAHGAVASGSVLFDERGGPVLAGFRAARLIGDFPATDTGQSLTPAQLDEQALAIDDRAGLRDLIGTVLDRLGGEEHHTSLASLRRCLEGPPSTEAELTGLIDRLFDLAPALPIRFDDDSRPPPESARPVRPLQQQIPPAEEFSPDQVSACDPSPVTRLRSFLVPLLSRLTRAGGSDENLLAPLRPRVRALIASVRTPVWIVGGAGLGALVIALTVIPAAHTATTAGSAAPSPSNDTRPANDLGESPSIGPSSIASQPPGESAAINGDDPLAAARALLAARTVCFRTRLVACFDGVDQAGSAALDADRELVRRLKKGVPIPAELTLDGVVPGSIQQLGDSAIVQLVTAGHSTQPAHKPAPLLLVRSEAGWRIRDLAVG